MARLFELTAPRPRRDGPRFRSGDSGNSIALGSRGRSSRNRGGGWSAARAAAGNAAVGCARPDPLDAAHTAALECLKALEWQHPAPEAGAAEQAWQTDELRRHIGDEVDEIVRMVRVRASGSARSRPDPIA